MDSNVILNTSITPGMILVPGSLIILKQKNSWFQQYFNNGKLLYEFWIINDDANKIEEKEP